MTALHISDEARAIAELERIANKAGEPDYDLCAVRVKDLRIALDALPTPPRTT